MRPLNPSISACLSGCAAILVVGVQDAAATTDLDGQLDTLRAEITEYRRARRSAEVESTRRRLTAQAIEARLTELGSTAVDAASNSRSDSAGWNGTFGWRSPDANFSLSVSAQLQIRYVVNRRSGDEGRSNDPAGVTRGLEQRRVRLVFSGVLVDPSWSYQIRGAFRRNGGEFFLEDTWIRKSLGDGVSVRVGQFKPPFLREDTVSSRRQLAVERSVVCDFFRQAWAQGIQATVLTDRVRVSGWFGDGIGPRSFGDARFNSINTPWQDTATSYSATGRVEWKLDGTWSQFDSFNSPRGSPRAAMLGAAIATQQANSNLGPADGTRVGAVTADATLCFSGASVFVSGVVAQIAPRTGRRSLPWGVTAQAGVYVLDPLELYLRYEYMDTDDPLQVDPRNTRFNGVTVGGTWFFAPEIKFSLDWIYNFASLAGGAFVSNGVGFRPDEAGETGQWAVRAQIQLVF